MTAFLKRQFEMDRGCAGHLHEQPEGRMHERRLRAPDAAGTILYIHGLGESALSFERLMADHRLAHWQHLAVDLEGYGKSMWAAEPLSLDQHADRIEQLIRQHQAHGDCDSVVVLGHSMGGVIGTLLSEQLGATARAFINVEGNISLTDCGYSGQAVKFSLDQWLAHGFDHVLDAIYHHEGEAPEVRRAYGASIQMCDPRTYHRNSQDLVEFSGTETGAERLAALDTAVVYIHGAPRGTGERSLELLEQSGIERIRIEDAGHWPFLDRHDLFVETMVGVLDSLAPA